MRSWLLFLLFGLVRAVLAYAEEPPADDDTLAHLRSGATREWSSFPQSAPTEWETKLPAARADRAHTIRLRQQDVKQSWRVLLNGKPLGDLTLDERDLRSEWPIAAGTLTGKDDVLRIEPRGKHALSDDIRVGQVELIERDPNVEPYTTVQVEIVDAESGKPLPCCLTIVDRRNTLVVTGNKSTNELAVRTGTIYTATGKATLKLPPERLTIFATRGFEYSLASQTIDASEKPPPHSYLLTLRREVPVSGYVACDAHVHTLTFSGHGDCTIDERMITLAGEGMELPIATDHNVFIDYESHAARMNVRQYFTPVVGNEVTTKVGHFNIFPAAAGSKLPNHNLTDWKPIFDECYGTPGVKVCILNHARDLHSGVRPFGLDRFNSVIGEQLDGWPMRFNAMEIINSGATQSDPLELPRDWMALLNRGYSVTPVGSSDSHDVARFIVGQGRTYIRVKDEDPSKIDVAAAMESFVAGRVLVSYGLLAELKVNGKHLPGDLVTDRERQVVAQVTVSSPHWIRPTKVQLYANGHLLHQVAIPAAEGEARGGIQWSQNWAFARPKHDVHLVAVATGPAVTEPYWAMARPYQPMSPDLKMLALGVSGPIWIDGDGDGRKTSARQYAEQAWKASRRDAAALLGRLAPYDAAVAEQAFHLYQANGGNLRSSDLQDARRLPQVLEGYNFYYDAWRETQKARAMK